MPGAAFIIALLLTIFTAAPLIAAEQGGERGKGTIFTLWPLIDYRESPPEGYSNLSILGPLFKLQRQRETSDLAVRPLFYNTHNSKDNWSMTQYLYPLGSSESSPEVSAIDILHLYQKSTYRKEEKQEKRSMFFPFYIHGKSDKYGPYTSVFPLYGDIYERFWRDEYHYVMFPVYGRTVKNGTTNTNFIYPLFCITSGENESGFQFWPLFGQSAKEGAYSKRFVLWPIFTHERTGLGTDNPTEKLYVLPLYAATDSPKVTARYYVWPFFGYRTEKDGNQVEHDYFWPFFRTIRGEKRNLDSFLPLYMHDRRKETSKRWIMWPILKHEEIDSADFRQERDRVLYFLYSDNRESWPKDGGKRRETKMWPLFFYQQDTRGVKSVSFPAPVEPVFDRDGIEKEWAPYWRLYQQRWDEHGDSAASFLWNLYWHEKRGEDLAFEFFPLIAYTSEKKETDLKVLKGLFRYRNEAGGKSLSLLWLPLGVHWGKAVKGPDSVAALDGGGKP